MIGYAVDDNRLATRFVNQIANHGKQFMLPSFADNGGPVFDRKHGLNVDLVVAVCHLGYNIGDNIPPIKIGGYQSAIPTGF